MIQIQLNDFTLNVVLFDIMTEKSIMNIYYNFLLDFCSFLTKSKGFTFDLSDLLLIHIVLFVVFTDETAQLTWLKFEEICYGLQRTP